jgi:hypothetical protein
MTWPPLDEQPSITICPATGGELCSDLAHTRQGIAASVVATFGRMPYLRSAECSGRSFAFCPPCWDRTRTVAEQMVPGIGIRTETAAAARPAP